MLYDPESDLDPFRSFDWTNWSNFMSSSDIDFGGKSFIANDSIMQIWLRLLVQQIDKIQDPPDWLAQAREDWHFQAIGAGSGYVELNLDGHLDSDSRTATIVRLSRQALRSLKEHDEYFTADELNAMNCHPGRIWFATLPLTEFVRTGDYFVKLLTGELSPFETDARFEPDAGQDSA